jgi:hypothetical protein
MWQMSHVHRINVMFNWLRPSNAAGPDRDYRILPARTKRARLNNLLMAATRIML